MNKELDKIKKKYEDIMSTSAKAKEKFGKRLFQLIAAQAEAEGLMQEAFDADDEKAYAKAKQAKEAAEAEAEFFKRKIEANSLGNLCGYDESNEVLDSIYETEKITVKRYANELDKLLQKIAELGATYDAEIEAAEELRRNWEREVHPLSLRREVDGVVSYQTIAGDRFWDNGLSRTFTELTDTREDLKRLCK